MYTEVWETGSFPQANAECKQQLCDREGDVLGTVRWSPLTHVHRISAESGVLWLQACMVMVFTPVASKKGNNFYHEVMPTVQFCRWLKGQPQLMNDILFTYVQFQCNGFTSTRNPHSWLYNNPHEVVQSSFQLIFSVNVWCGIGGSHLCSMWTFDSCFFQTFPGVWIRASFRKYSFSNNTVNVDTIRWSTPTFWQRGCGVLECRFPRKVERTGWTSCVAS
jgi:hypothetical protein